MSSSTAGISDRYKYNERCISRAERERSSVLGTHGGFSDLFVPVCVEKQSARDADCRALWYALAKRC